MIFNRDNIGTNFPINWIFVPIFICIALFYLQLCNNLWVIDADATTYMAGATSLAQGRGYVDHEGHLITIYPPLTSLLYSSAVFSLKNGYYLFNFITKCFTVSFLWMCFLFLRRKAGYFAALFSIVFLSLSTTLISQSVIISSDIIFSFLFILTLYFFDLERIERLTGLQAAALGLLVTVCYYGRTVGLFIFTGYFLGLLVYCKTNKWKKLLIFSGIFIFFAAILTALNLGAEVKRSYFSMMLLKADWIPDSGTATLNDWIIRLASNLKIILRAVSSFFSNGSRFGSLGTISLLLIGVGGCRALFDKRSHLYLFFLLFYMIELVTAVGPLPIRYLLPIAPLLLLFIINALQIPFERLQGMNKKLSAIALNGALLLFLTYYGNQGYQRSLTIRSVIHETPSHVLYSWNEDFQKMIDIHSVQLKPGDIIATQIPPLVRYFVPSSITVTSFMHTINNDKLFTSLIVKKVTYVYADKKLQQTKSYLLPTIQKFKENFVVISENQNAAIYKTNFTTETKSQ